MTISKIKIFSFLLVFSLLSSMNLFSQEVSINYAYVSVVGKEFSKKLKVTIDFGEADEQIKTGDSYAEELEETKSYATILNYMDSKGFELVETMILQESYSFQGTGGGGVAGIVFIMKRKKSAANIK